MKDLRPIGEILVSVEARDLTAAQLTEAHQAVQVELRQKKDIEGAMLQFAWLGLVAIERVKRMEESHAGDLHRSSDRGRGAGGDPAPVRSGAGWIHRPSTEPAATSVRPH